MGRAPGRDDDWDGDRAERWVRMEKGLERQLAPVSELLFSSADLRPGERVLDVGCGTGPTTRAAAAAVGPTGAVTGVDVSRLMLDAAEVAVPDPRSAAVEWVEADVVGWRPAGERYDVVLSRFGVMFFSDPPAAFAGLAELTRPGGRLHLAVWADRSRSALFELPLSVVIGCRRGWGLETVVPPADDGPFSLGDADRLRALLEGAGWSAVSIDARPLVLPVAGGLPPAEAARASLEFGPTRLVTADLDDQRRDEVVGAIAEAYADHVDGDGRVVVGATPVLVSATRPG